MYLLETLVALTVGGFISFALLDVICGAMRTMETTANESAAAEILDELSEQTRSFGYSRLFKFVGLSTSMVVNRTTSSVFAEPDFHNRQLSLDLVNRVWNPRTQMNAFGESNGGTVLYTVSNGPSSDSITVKVDIQWSDSKSTSTRTASRSIVLFRTD